MLKKIHNLRLRRGPGENGDLLSLAIHTRLKNLRLRESKLIIAEFMGFLGMFAGSFMQH